ncbi:hypothetical protein ACP70R_017922 [Stipagrostis hirtigluma subsp. patula]
MADGTLHGQAPPAAGEGAGRPSPTRFTALELAVAEQLIHLSESSSSAAFTPQGAPGPASAASAASSSSPRSVNAPVPAAAALPVEAAGDDEEEDEQEVGGSRRRNKRNRPLAEIYAETKPIGGGGRKGKPRPAGDGKEKARK